MVFGDFDVLNMLHRMGLHSCISNVGATISGNGLLDGFVIVDGSDSIDNSINASATIISRPLPT